METEISKHQHFSVNLMHAKACFELPLDFFASEFWLLFDKEEGEDIDRRVRLQ